MTKLNYFTFIIILTTFFACKTGKISFNTVTVDNIDGDKQLKTLYFLPRTVIDVELELEKTSFIKGPYHKYAKSYLNIDSVIDKNKNIWKITNVKITTSAVPDTNKTYIIETDNKEDVVALELTKSGYIKSVNPRGIYNDNYEKYRRDSEKSDKMTERNYKDFVKNKFGLNNVPLPKEVISKRTTREQALALSNKIISLREDRSAILVGDGYTETMPDGKALKIMLDKIDLIQQQYLSMFKGKVVRGNLKYKFCYTPNSTRKLTQAILCRFSEEKGIVENTDMSGTPIIIEIQSNESLKKYRKYKETQIFLEQSSKRKAKGFHYNIPEIANVSIIKDDERLSNIIAPICQLGTVSILPENYFNGKYTIEFFPKLGSIKSIKKSQLKD